MYADYHIVSYMYTGFAVRTALAIGINREPLPDSKKGLALLKAETRTWWYVILIPIKFVSFLKAVVE